MNEAENKVKSQIVEKIKASTNILITVSKDPSVDELSAAIGLTALLNKLDKHATAIFSGVLPPAITFLEPEKVFENTADSLRDFIIALDKEKADHLRYKIDGDVVKIFITPYKTTITDADLEFSQGDYNIELVLALGVTNQDHLDTALSSQGQMLKDVTVATFSAGDTASQLGSIDWRNISACGFSEMVTIISDLLKTDKTLLDKQIATALLTGIVYSTERFSNPKTTSSVMTIAAQLMAAGADQQLIASKLQEAHEINALPNSAKQADEVILDIPTSTLSEAEAVKPIDTGSLVISHEPETKTDADESPEIKSPEPEQNSVSTLPTVENTNGDDVPTAQEILGVKTEMHEEPLLGGILNATSDQAADDAKRILDEQQNKTILSHSYLTGSDQPLPDPLINSVGQENEEVKNIDIFSDAPMSTLPDVAPITPASIGLPLPPPLPDFSSTIPPVSHPETTGIPIETPTISPIISTLPEAPVGTASDPSQFKIPGQL